MKISRSDLCDFVWSQPRTQLSKRFGISDVALAKRCKKANIPMPPRGHWAKLEGKRPVKRGTLPLRLPGEDDVVDFERNSWYRGRSVTLEDQLVAPAFPESIESLVAPALAKMGRVRAVRDLSAPHSGLSKVLAAEASRREQYEANALVVLQAVLRRSALPTATAPDQFAASGFQSPGVQGMGGREDASGSRE